MDNYDIMEITIYIVVYVVSLVAILKFQDYRLKKVEKRLDEHNHYAKLYNDSKNEITGIKKDIENVNRSLEQQYQALLRLGERLDKLFEKD